METSGKVQTILMFCKDVVISSAIWVLIGVPVTAAICALQMYIWVILILPELAALAALMGALQGLWLRLACWRHTLKRPYSFLLGSISGGVLGLLAFAPMYSDSQIVVEEVTSTTLFTLIVSGVLGGTAAGVMTTRILRLPRKLMEGSSSRALIVSAIFPALLLVIDYYLFWNEISERLPIQEVSVKEIAGLSRGDAKGSSWSGCYLIGGHKASRTGGEGGYIIVNQNDGALQITGPLSKKYLGGVDRNGTFRFGSETILGT